MRIPVLDRLARRTVQVILEARIDRDGFTRWVQVLQQVHFECKRV